MGIQESSVILAWKSSAAALLMGLGFDHAPPHFHAIYAEDEASIDIRTLTVVRGAVPRRALAMILEWASLHREELLQNGICAQ